MTVKLMVLLKRKPGMSEQEFQARYEAVHAPLCKRLSPAMATYRRNYVRETLSGEPPACDVITEVTFADRAAYERAMAGSVGDPAKAGLIAEDELQQFDTTSIQMFLVEECVSDMTQP